MESIQIVKLPQKRWKEYKQLRLEALEKEPLAFGSSFEEEKDLSEKEWKKRMKTTVVALHSNKPIGMIIYIFQQKRKLKHTANIYGVYVTRKYCKQGIGTKLMESALSHILKNKEIVKICLGVTPEQKAALRLYKKYGFKIVGRLKKDMKIKNKFYDHFIMEKLL